jgi:2-isopropylmalate synthase
MMSAAPQAPVARARTLRRSMTDAEARLWRLLRDRRFDGATFRRQVPVGPYVADFLSFGHRPVVEADGGQHAGALRDAARDAFFRRSGFRVLRFCNNDILGNTEGVLEALLLELRRAARSTPHPRPFSRKGGGEAGSSSATASAASPAAPTDAQGANPSPLAGEGGSRRSRETGEGAASAAAPPEAVARPTPHPRPHTPKRRGEEDEHAAMAKERLYLFDTTLRDGAQTNGVDFTVADKLKVMGLLDGLGVDYIEAGYPGANPTDTQLFAESHPARARVTAFGMTKRPGRSAANDPGVAALLEAKADAICFVAKASAYQVRVALECSKEDNLDSIRDSVKAAVAAGREALVDCEHFFDGYKEDPDFALACARTAFEAGARWVVLCDTNGGTLPHEVEEIVRAVVEVVPGDHVGIHAHNDTEQAVANSLAAVRAGARQIQGTLNGLGERCGNANLVSLIPTLLLKAGFADRFEIGVDRERLAHLAQVSRTLDEMLNRAPNRHAPYVGDSAFATKAGIHASAILKDPATYEHVPPELVGNRRRVMVSDQAGKSNVLSELERLGVAVDKGDPRVARLLDEVKSREALGYAYEAADASFALLAKRMLGTVPDFFRVERFSVKVERRFNAKGEMTTVAEAIVKVEVDGEVLISAAEGNGPVNALDVALRKDLGKYQPLIGGLKLTDYRVRILDGGTEAITRVLIESVDETGDRWTTVGVSPNIIDASFQALIDSITWKLLKEGARA